MKKNLQTAFTPMTRREFMKSSVAGLGLLAFTNYAPAFLTQSVAAGMPPAEKDKRVLVVIQLAGGNDGLNTVVPFRDDRYYGLRPTLSIKPSEVIRLTDDLGLHPDCGPLSELYKNGRLSIVQNVGYPNPNRSHFRSMEIWETASSSDETRYNGWLGSYLDNECSGTARTDPVAIHLGEDIPNSLMASKNHSVFGIPAKGNLASSGNPSLLSKLTALPMEHPEGTYLQQTLLNTMVTEKRVGEVIRAYAPMADYGESSFAQSLKRIASLIASGLETRVYFATLGGFDTHATQAPSHSKLLKELSGGLAAFQKDIEAHGLGNRVLTMTFSEFGRRPAENASGGTDHGTAAPLFVMSQSIQSPLLGTHPNLNINARQDLEFSTDFRQVYATVLSKWLECDASRILDGRFDPLPIIG